MFILLSVLIFLKRKKSYKKYMQRRARQVVFQLAGDNILETEGVLVCSVEGDVILMITTQSIHKD
jgi:hypothetical protein